MPEPPKNQPDEAQKKPVENKKDSFVINGEDPRAYNPFSDKIKEDDEM